MPGEPFQEFTASSAQSSHLHLFIWNSNNLGSKQVDCDYSKKTIAASLVGSPTDAHSSYRYSLLKYSLRGTSQNTYIHCEIMSDSSEDIPQTEELLSVDVQPSSLTLNEEQEQSQGVEIREGAADILKGLSVQEEKSDNLEVDVPKVDPLPQEADLQQQVEMSDSEASVHQETQSEDDEGSKEQMCSGASDLLKEVRIEEDFRPEDAAAHTSTATREEGEVAGEEEDDDDDDKPLIEILEVQGRVVHVIGTAHVSKKSCEDVSCIIRRVRPQVSFAHSKNNILDNSPRVRLFMEYSMAPCIFPIFQSWSGTLAEIFRQVLSTRKSLANEHMQTKRHRSKHIPSTDAHST